MIRFFFTFSKITEEVFLPFFFISLGLTIIWIILAGPKRRIIAVLGLLFIFTLTVRCFCTSVPSSRYFLIFTVGALLGSGLGLEEIFRRSKKIGWGLIGLILIIICLKTFFQLKHPPCWDIIGKKIADDAQHFPRAVIMSESESDMIRLSYYSGIPFVYSSPQEWTKTIWNAHYIAPVIYYVGTGTKPFQSAYSFQIPGLQAKQEINLLFHTYKDYHKKKELYIYRQENQEDVFLPEKSRTLLPNGNFEEGVERVAYPNQMFILERPKFWGILNYRDLDQDKALTVRPVHDAGSSTTEIEITMQPQNSQSQLLFFSSPFIPNPQSWISFEATLSSDSIIEVLFGVYDAKGNGLGEEAVLYLNGKVNQEKRQYRIPLAPELWGKQGDSKRLFFRIWQGTIRLGNFYRVEY